MPPCLKRCKSKIYQITNYTKYRQFLGLEWIENASNKLACAEALRSALVF